MTSRKLNTLKVLKSNNTKVKINMKRIVKLSEHISLTDNVLFLRAGIGLS